MKIVIQDANILIDLLNIELFTKTLDLHFQFVTTNFIINELNFKQITRLDQAIETNRLVIHYSDHIELEEIYNIHIQTNRLSVADCSVLLLARKTNGTLLTGDRYLKKHARKFDLIVHGIIWILDQLIDSRLITKVMAIEKIKLLIAGNNRLPKDICNQRIKFWSK